VEVVIFLEFWAVVRSPPWGVRKWGGGGGWWCGHPGRQNGQKREYFELKID